MYDILFKRCKDTHKVAEHCGTCGESAEVDEKAPPGWEGTVLAMKKHGIKNPWRLAWYMKGKGYKPRHKESVEEMAGEECLVCGKPSDDAFCSKECEDTSMYMLAGEPKPQECKEGNAEEVEAMSRNEMIEYLEGVRRIITDPENYTDEELQDMVKEEMGIKEHAECEILTRHFESKIQKGEKLSESEQKFLKVHRAEFNALSEELQGKVEACIAQLLKEESK